MCYLSAAVPFSFAVCALRKCLGLLVWDFADVKHVFQIRPSDGGYGFTLEEKNRVPIIKSVEKGSPAEVRYLSSKEHFGQIYLSHGLTSSRLVDVRGCNVIPFSVAERVSWWISTRTDRVNWVDLSPVSPVTLAKALTGE